MERLSKQVLKRLMDEKRGPCVSISFGTQRIPVQEKPDRIKLDNLLRRAEGELSASGMRTADARRLLRPVWNLLEPANEGFWQHQGNGLSIFCSPDTFEYFRLSYPPRESLFVSDHFQLKPLLRLLSGNGQFYILALSVDGIVLHQGGPNGLLAVDVSSLPDSLAQALRANRISEILASHAPVVTGAVGREMPILTRGRAPGDGAHNRLLQYFQEVRSGIDEFLAGEKVPLLLAGADYLPAVYREVNTYPHLVEEAIAADPSRLTVEELHRRAWSIIGRTFENARRNAAERYKPLARTKSASHDVSEIVPAAYYGKADVVFVSSVSECFGRFNEAEGMVQTEDRAGPGVVDLLDFAAAHTFLTGGTAYVVPPEEIPDNAPIAAIFRY